MYKKEKKRKEIQLCEAEILQTSTSLAHWVLQPGPLPARANFYESCCLQSVLPCLHQRTPRCNTFRSLSVAPSVERQLTIDLCHGTIQLLKSSVRELLLCYALELASAFVARFAMGRLTIQAVLAFFLGRPCSCLMATSPSASHLLALTSWMTFMICL